MNIHKKIIILLFIFSGFLLASCKSTKISKDEIKELQSLKKIFIEPYFDDSIIVNDKHILYDLTADYFKYNKINDVTKDSNIDSELSTDTKKDKIDIYFDDSKYIFNKREIQEISFYKSKFKDYTKNSLLEYFKNSDLTIDIIDLSTDIPENSFVLSINCVEYQIGEFNYITNLPTKMEIEVLLYKKDTKSKENKEKQYIKYVKSYKAKADIAHSIEIMRINNITDKIAKDIGNLILKYKKKKVMHKTDKKNGKVKDNKKQKKINKENNKK